MKNLLVAVIFGTFGLNALAALDADVLAEQTVHVGFAPAEMRGVHKFQLLKSGILQKIDNHQQVTVVGSLSTDLTNKFQAKVDSIADATLSRPEGHICMDAPSYETTVRKSSGEEIVVNRKSGCRSSVATDEAAEHVATAFERLEDGFGSLNYYLEVR